MQERQLITFGSLFAGIGGLDLGLERAGMECRWQVEIDNYATRVLEKHWPRVRRWKDIRTFPPHPNSESESAVSVDEKEWQGHSGSTGWEVDLISAGWPCQDISTAGPKEGIQGKKSGLFFEVIRIVCVLEPKFILLENVAALLNRGLGNVLGSLAAIGYDAEWHCLQAADFGAPHIRDRIFILAHRQRDGSEARLSTPASWPQGNSKKSHNTGDRFDGWQGFSHWATEPRMDRVADGIPHRMDRLRGLGNAVVPQIAEWIGKQILEGSNAVDG